MDNVAEIAGKLTKASRRALVRIRPHEWTEEGAPGPSREDVYSLYWGKDGKKKLVESPISFALTFCSCRWKWKLTPLGLAVRAHLIANQ